MPKPSKETCLCDLRRRILSTELEPGADLDEAGLAAYYCMSRTPMREVLQRLAGAGFIRLEENRSAKVSSMDISTLRTFFQTAPLIYSNISRLAAENRTAEQLDELKDVQAGFAHTTSAGDAAGAALLNHRFHAIIGEMAQNPYLKSSLDRMLIDHTRLSQTFYRPASEEETMLVRKASDQHDALIAAIEAQEPALAVDLTLQHWDLSRDRLERYARPDPLPVNITDLKGYRDAV